MRRLWVALSFALPIAILGVEPSTATDLPARVLKAAPLSPVSYAWNGFYVGLSGGYGRNDSDVTIGIADPFGVIQNVAAAGGFPVTYSFTRDGFIFGPQAGYNYQVGQFLVGVEGDISAAGIDGSVTVFTPRCAICGFPVTSTVSQNMDWFSTLRARVGYVMGQWLVYGTGGLAIGHVKYSYLQTNAPFGGTLTATAAQDNVEVGWTVGAGVEYGFERWSGKLEYLYYDLGDRSFFVQNPLAPAGIGLLPNFPNNGSIIRAGLNYHL